MQKLSDKQRLLIEKNLTEITKILTYTMKRRRSIIDSPLSVAVSEAIGYLPEIAQEYDESISSKMPFVTFASQRCFYRIIDEYRRNKRYLRKNIEKTKIVENAKKSLQEDIDNPDEYDISEKLKEQGKDPEKYLSATKVVRKSLSKLKTKAAINNPGIDEVEWEDLKSALINKSNEFFVECGDGDHIKYKGRHSKLYKTLIKDYLIPKSQGVPYRTLREIAQQFVLSEPLLSRMVRDDNMKSFIRMIYDKRVRDDEKVED